MDYNVYQNGAPAQTGVVGTSTTVTGLNSDTQYTFTIQARDAALNVSTDGPSTVATTLPGLPVVSVTATDGAEAGSVDGVFTVSRTGSTTAALSVVVDLAGSTATAPPAADADYVVAVPSPVVIPVGQASVDVLVDPVDDAVDEGDETVNMAIVADPAYEIGVPAAATVTIVDDDLPVVSVTATDGAEAGSVDGVFTVSRTGSTTAALSVVVDLAGSTATAPPAADADYVVAVPSPVVIPVGQASVDVLVDPVDDAVDEGDETVNMAIVADPAYEIGVPAAATVTIVDDDLPVVSVTATDGAEAGSVDGVFTVSRTGSTTAALSVVVDLAGSTATAPPAADADYVVAVPSPVVIPVGQASVDVLVDPVDDAVDEGDETVNMAIVADPAYEIGVPAAATVTIVDRDVTPPVVSGRDPVPGAVGVPVGASVVVTFDEVMDPVTLNASTFTLRAEGAGSDVAAVVTPAGSGATLVPDTDLVEGTLYTVTVDASVADVAGNPLGADETWGFTTAVVSSPEGFGFYRSSNGRWYVPGENSVGFSIAGEESDIIPVPGD